MSVGVGDGKRVDTRQNESYERVHRIMGVNRWRSASFARPFFFLSSPYQLSCINRSTRLTMSQPERDIVLEYGRLFSKGQKGTQKWGHDNRKSSRGWSGMMMVGRGWRRTHWRRYHSNRLFSISTFSGARLPPDGPNAFVCQDIQYHRALSALLGCSEPLFDGGIYSNTVLEITE